MENPNEMLKKVSPLVHECAVLKTNEIPFRSAVRKACKRNQCGFYGASFSCPPAVGELPILQKKCLSYRYALVFSSLGILEDSFDFEGMMRQRDVHDALQEKVRKILHLEKNLLLGAGACRICKTCQYPKPCLFPDKMVPSVESHGIDVVELTKNISLHYCNGINTVTYFSILFFS